MPAVKFVADEMDVLDPELRRLVDVELAAEVQRRRLLPGEVARAARRRVLEVDPDTAAKRAAKARATRRRVSLCDPSDGMAGVVARLRAEEALAVFRRLDATARGMRSAGDPRSLDDLMADDFVASLVGDLVPPPADGQQPPTWAADDAGLEPWLLTDPPPREWEQDPDPAPDDPAWDTWTDPDLSDDQPAPTGQAPTGRVADRIELQVVLTAQMLLGLDDAPALLRGYGALPMPTVRDMVREQEDAGGQTVLRRLFVDPTDGRLLTMETDTRRVTGLLRKLATWRELHRCRLTGGRLRDLDHPEPKVRGGPTSARNSQGLSRRAHTFKDHPDVQVRLIDADRRRAPDDGLDQWRPHSPDIEWTLPSGTTVLRPPPPALGDGSTTISPLEHPSGDAADEVDDWSVSP